MVDPKFFEDEGKKLAQLFVKKEVEKTLRAQAGSAELGKGGADALQMEAIEEWEKTYKKEPRPERKNKTRNARMNAKKAAVKQKKAASKGQKK